jgi:MbtH protein
MRGNPFELAKASYRVLLNSQGQYSLWPAFATVPAGWRVVCEERGREACLSLIMRANGNGASS